MGQDLIELKPYLAGIETTIQHLADTALPAHRGRIADSLDTIGYTLQELVDVLGKLRGDLYRETLPPNVALRAIRDAIHHLAAATGRE